MPNSLVTVVGDVFVEQFRPVEWKRESAYGDNAFVYRSADKTDGLRTQSPGGAAFLTLLLRRANLAVQAVLPVRKEWDASLMLSTASGQTDPKPAKPMLRFQAPSQLNRIESFYVAVEERWRLEMRVDEFHEATAASTPAVEASSILVIDDYARNAINSEVLACVAKANAETVIINGQARHQQLYKHLLQSAKTTVLVCSERQALMWSEVPDPPIRFPPGNISHHQELLRLIVTRMIVSFPNLGHIIIVRTGAQVTAVHVQCSQEEGKPHDVTSFEESGDHLRRPQSASTPGAETYYLAAVVRSLMAAPHDVRRAVSFGVAATSEYEMAAVAQRDGYFGRLEAIPSLDLENRVGRTYVMSIDPKRPPQPVPASAYLRRAQIDGRLPRERSTLPDYYAPKAVETQISGLLGALAAYGQKSSTRPFNVLLNAEPGSGKSYFAQCLARHLDQVSSQGGGPVGQHPLIESNLSNAGTSEQIDLALLDLYETVRDHRAVGKTPVVLLDEFDTLLSGWSAGQTPGPMDRLFAQMLAPLWDGVFLVDGRRRRLGGFVLLIAVSSQNFLDYLERPGKGRDFASRLDVRLNLSLPETPSPEESEKGNVLVAVAMLKKHFGSHTPRVQLAVLDAIGKANFSGRNRAIDQLIMMSSRPASGIFTLRDLPAADLIRNLVTGLDMKDIESSRDRYGDSFIEL